MSSQDVAAGVARLCGARLEAVTFVMDYVQFQFEAAHLTTYTLPVVATAGNCVTSQELGWRDLLCARIGVKVRGASCLEDRLQLDFDDGVVVIVSLKDDDYRGPEAFMLSSLGHDLIVS